MTVAEHSTDVTHPVVSDFIARGYHVFEGGVDPAAASALLAKIRALRTFDADLFLSEAAFDADPQYIGVNPAPGRNLLERFEDDLAFVEKDPAIVAAVSALLGDGYEILLKKLICGVPSSVVPNWLKARIAGNPVNNLGAYVKAPFRDITYFYGIDFHQDLIDYKDREADFITLYIYLHDVGAHDAPLFLLEDSHRLGGTLFPHDLTKNPEGWLYRDGRGHEIQTKQHLLTGKAGYAAMWHACTLHGTQPDAADNERLSLRYLIARKPGAPAPGMDAVNATLLGPLSLEATRQDLDARGAAQIKANSVNKA
uniref:Phytanoyl-CoA dioxygenase n=1 Tax=Caulobacter sp. (strain K31) TaxID=366602 RepID=B0T296_CAUSK